MTTKIDVATIDGARRSLFPPTFAPMLASLPAGPLGKPGTWTFEPKLDGIRCIALIKDGVARLLSRRGLDLTSQYPGLAKEIPNRFPHDGILDGEIIALNSKGQPSFQQLQQRMNLTKEADVQRAEVTVPAHYFVFDIVRYGEFDLTAARLKDRKPLLQQLLSTSDRVHLIPTFDCEGQIAYDVCVENGFEGIVAKRTESPYEVGRRSPYWVKLKAQQTGEFVIGGYSPGEGSRAKTFGALLLGHYDEKGKFIYCGSVGTGFDDRLLAETLRRLKPHLTKKCPFAAVPSDKRQSTWVSPEVVAEIKYMDMTRDGHLRTPVFLHFRDDKVAAEILPVIEPNPYEQVLGQLAGNEAKLDLIVDNEKVSLTSLGKELWPNITKRDYLRFLTQMAPSLLPHWQGRPMTLIRSPFGIKGKSFFQKHWHTTLPEFVDTADDYLLCNNLASLLFFAQNGVLEFHTSLSRLDQLDQPDFITFDLDCHADLNLEAFKRACEVALLLNDYLKAAKLRSFVKVSGKNGLHVFVPIKREFGFEGTRALAETIAKFFVQQNPDVVTIELSVKKRDGKVYLDCSSNGSGRTIASPYTPRAVEWASVSAPVTWGELPEFLPTDLTLYTMATRLASVGDIWADILTKKNDLDSALAKRNTK